MTRSWAARRPAWQGPRRRGTARENCRAAACVPVATPHRDDVAAARYLVQRHPVRCRLGSSGAPGTWRLGCHLPPGW